jgi:superfamily II DNA helicase RecQ
MNEEPLTSPLWLNPQGLVHQWQQATQQLVLGLLLLCPQPQLTAHEAQALLQQEQCPLPLPMVQATLEALSEAGWVSCSAGPKEGSPKDGSKGYALTASGLAQMKQRAKPPVAQPVNALPPKEETLPAPPSVPAFLVREKKAPSKPPSSKAAKPPVVVPAVPLPTTPQPPPLDADPLYQKLRALRGQLAQGEGVKLYHVCSNAVLRAMALQQPTHPSALEALPGVGPVFCTKYAPAFLELLVKHHLQ